MQELSDIFEQFHILIDFFGHVLSSNYEIALLDLRNGINCITKLANGHVTQRAEGAPITDLALQIIQSGEYKNKGYLVNYTGMSSENRVLRSSSFFIKDGEKLLGMLCINVDMNNYIQLCEEIMALSGTSVSSVELIPKSDCTATDLPAENFSNDLSTSIDNILKQQSKHLTTLPSRLNKKERMNFIKDLNKSGLFL